MGKNRRKMRAARLVGSMIGVLFALLIAVILIRGSGELLIGGAQLLREAGEEDAPLHTPVPTMPPLDEEPFAEEERDMQDTGAEQIEVPVLMTPEELAETAPDLTPPPDAPVG